MLTMLDWCKYDSPVHHICTTFFRKEPARDVSKGLVNRSVALTQRQLNKLEAQSKHLGITVGELIRRILDNHLDEKGREPREL
jgi:hypothetical protein